MASITFTDSIGLAVLTNGKPYPADRFGNWVPDSAPSGDAAARQSDGGITMFRLRDDFCAAFELPLIPSRRGNNLALHSGALDNAAWTKDATTIAADTTTAPNGVTSADKINETAVTNTFTVHQQTPISLSTDGVYVLSSHFKPLERSWAYLLLSGKDGTSRYQTFDLGNGRKGTTFGGLTDAGMSKAANGFYRCWIAATVASGGSTPGFYLGVSATDSASSYAGSAGAGIYAWGAQVDTYSGWLGPSPYIGTSGAIIQDLAQIDVADRLIYHLQNGGQCTVATGDAANSAYATCGLRKGTAPSLQLDRRTMEYTLSLQLLNTAGSPARMLARYAEQ